MSVGPSHIVFKALANPMVTGKGAAVGLLENASALRKWISLVQRWPDLKIGSWRAWPLQRLPRQPTITNLKEPSKQPFLKMSSPL